MNPDQLASSEPADLDLYCFVFSNKGIEVWKKSYVQYTLKVNPLLRRLFLYHDISFYF